MGRRIFENLGPNLPLWLIERRITKTPKIGRSPPEFLSLPYDKRRIEAMIKQLEQNYAVRDKQDVLAMCALQFASQIEQKGIVNNRTNIEVEERLKALNELLHTHLS